VTEPPIDEIQPGGGASRPASVRLRDGAGAQDAAMMDPANQSLADALRITFGLLQFAMIALAALFVFSGFQTVKEGERGIAVLFGRAVSTNLDPGFHFAAPYPLGELIKVNTGNIAPELNREFWPFVSQNASSDSIENLQGRSQLNPERDGSLITADLNIAHTQWQAVYRRESPVQYVENIYADHEDMIVRAALKRGVVRTIATIGIDELLKPQEGGTRAIAQRAQELAQQTLDEIGSGIRIERFELGQRTAPGSLLRKFRAVLDARSEAQKAITEARSERARLLNSAAGTAGDALLWLISRYELAIETGEAEEARAVLARIDAAFEGSPIEFTEAERALLGSDPLLAGALAAEGRSASGDVVEIIQGAAVDRLSIVQEARGELELFRAKQGQFRANPSLMVQRDWAGAWAEFQSRPFVQTMLLPVGHGAELWLNADPDIIKELDRARKEIDRLRAVQERERAQREAQYRVDRGIRVEDE